MQKIKLLQRSFHSGVLSITALVFIAVFVFVLIGLVDVSLMQKKVEVSKEEGSKALTISEAGLEYYRWRLGHYPNDIQDGTGHTGPYVHDFLDPEGSAIGKYSLAISGNYQCGSLMSVDVVSTAWTNAHPEIKKTITGRYMRPSVSNFSYILNSNVLVGNDRIIYGPYHSNGGIDFEGTNYSSVTSAQTTWNCSSSYCSPVQSSAPGVTHDSGGTGAGSNLWKSPVPQIDFTIISQNLTDIYRKNVASTTPGVCNAGQGLGCYFPRTNPGSAMTLGYHLIFNPEGTFTLYKVLSTESVPGVPVSYGIADCAHKVSENSVISNSGSNGICPYTPSGTAQSLIGTFAPPTSCKLLYFDDNVWLEGNLNGKISVIAASSTSSENPNIYIRNSINYTPSDGTADGLTALAENSVKVPPDSPDNLSADGIFIAQLGYFGRDYYDTSCGLASKYSGCAFQNQMNIYGTVVSNGRVGTKWGNVNGYNTRIDNYDSTLFNDPPPMTPYTEDTYKFVQWTQDQ